MLRIRRRQNCHPSRPAVCSLATSKGAGDPAILMLEDGTIFYGRACGAPGTAVGEVCFNTSLEGTSRMATDPSYAGQIVTMTISPDG